MRRLRPEEALETLYRNTVSRTQGAMEAMTRLLGDADTRACALPPGDPVGSLQMMTRSLS